MNNNVFSAYEQGLNYLNNKMYSCRDLSDKLKQKGYEEAEIEEAINLLISDNFLNDEKYAEIFIQNLLSYRDFGYYGIRRKLFLKKIEKSIIDKLVEKYVTIEVEDEVAKKFIQKNKHKSKKSLMQSMQRKGFRTEVILRGISA